MPELASYLREDLIIEISKRDKQEALREMMDKVEESNLLPNANDFFDLILKREKQVSTGIGLGIAVPHARIEGFGKILIAVGHSMEGIDFTTPDGTPVHLIFLIAIDSELQGEYLRILSKISWLVRNDELRKKLFLSKTTDDIYRILLNHH